MSYGTPQGRPEDDPARYGRFRQLGSEFAKFAVIGVTGVFITNAVYDLLHLGHDKLAGLAALNAGIALATLFRFWSYRRFVWVKPPAAADGQGRKFPWYRLSGTISGTTPGGVRHVHHRQ